MKEETREARMIRRMLKVARREELLHLIKAREAREQVISETLEELNFTVDEPTEV